ncbi:MAG: hypothetical protein AAGB34_08655 [Planctomycetota bacterium]
MIFTGQYEHSIDAKNRIAIPADIRARWSTEHDGEAWQALPWKQGVIRLYTERDFAQAADRGRLTLTPDEDEAEIDATIFGLSERLPMDSAGRIRIPEGHLELAGLNKEVVIIGARDRLELRDRAEWNSQRNDRLAQLQAFMKRNAQRSADASAG